MPQTIMTILFMIMTPSSAIADDTILDVPRNGALEVQIDGTAVTVFSSPGMPSTLQIRQSLGEAIFGDAVAQEAQENSGFRIFSITRPRGEIEKKSAQLGCQASSCHLRSVLAGKLRSRMFLGIGKAPMNLVKV